MFLPLEYINYYLVAKGRHGIHSPFAYDFIDKCVRSPLDKDFILKRNLLFSELKKSNEIISVADFGVGSKKMGNQRKVSSILKNSSSKGKYADLLYRISDFYKPKKILEFGTSLGIGSIHLKAGNPDCEITTVEACHETLVVAQRNFKEFNFDIHIQNKTFQDYISTLSNDKFDLIYIDGHHDGNALLNYLEMLKPFTHNDTLFILDDIRWSNSMLLAWKKLSQSDFFHVSIDLLRIGILTPRKQQRKQHFVFRY